MRIRKRQVPFPLSSLSPVPISDPLLSLNRPPPVPVPVPVVVQLHPMVAPRNDAVNPNENPPQPSDHLSDHHPQPIGKGTAMINGWEEEKMKKEKKEEEEDRLELLQEEDKKEEDGEKGNHISKENTLGAKTVSGFLLESSTNSAQVLGRWSEGERAFPPKKRRGMGFERPDIIHLNSSKAVNKTKTNSSNKKSWCSTSTSRKNDDDDNDVDLDHDQEKKEHSTTTSTNKETKMVSNKNKSRGGALMEGSRCSRVNGRGWRCCQQTLVGYSLCEHHLGKGRLRSMTSVRSRSLAAKSSAPPPPPRDDVNLDDKAVINKLGDADDQGVAENEDFKGNGRNGEEIKNNNKKRMKLGMVKARSISSLLGQTNGAIPMVDFSK